ncbi:DUF4238 domain-containing protein [Hymenobacter sp. BT491]|uniref:DUF4238 domain-containing protein n=1 Tax=Hymenobacter sp. BT491 TaxID=2766779 RepID=UPI00165379B2|nr:DUF4238 domain-containing protein [Hymenobacter sp. BT491]MBC6992088.1 DUF4238 domain-containing protein [Hymenobacter sp. BT491]
MKSQEVTKQHFVPRTYLKHFGQQENGQDKIYRAMRDDADPASVRQVSVASVCFQNDLYTLEGESSAERMALEDFYRTSVEDEYDALREVLLDQHQKTASEELRSQVLHTVATMLMRTTKLLSRSNTLMDRVLERMMTLCELTGKQAFDFEGEMHSVKGKTLAELRREFRKQNQPSHALTQVELALRLGEAKQNDFGIVVLTIDEAAGEYITSDNPVLISSLDRFNTAFNPDAALRLPLGPKHMLWLMPKAHDMLKNRITRWSMGGDQAKLERMAANITQQHNAERWLLGNQAAVQLHIRERVTMQYDLDNPTPETMGQAVHERMKRLGFL